MDKDSIPKDDIVMPPLQKSFEEKKPAKVPKKRSSLPLPFKSPSKLLGDDVLPTSKRQKSRKKLKKKKRRVLSLNPQAKKIAKAAEAHAAKEKKRELPHPQWDYLFLSFFAGVATSM